jgi:hypothetical protein
VSFYSGTQAELLYALPAAVTKNTYTTQAVLSVPGSSTLPRCIVPGKFFTSVPYGVGRSLWLHAEGTIANTAAATFTGVLGWDPTAGTLDHILADPGPYRFHYMPVVSGRLVHLPAGGFGWADVAGERGVRAVGGGVRSPVHRGAEGEDADLSDGYQRGGGRLHRAVGYVVGELGVEYYDPSADVAIRFELADP